MQETRAELRGNPPASAILARSAGRQVSRRDFARDVRSVASRLPAAPAVVLQLDSRYAFLVAFTAGFLRGKTVVLPAALGDHAKRGVLARHGEAFLLTDREVAAMIHGAIADTGDAGERDLIDPSELASGSVEVFTSGTTGEPVVHRKRWPELAALADLYMERLPLASEAGATVVATVPPSHMYGLETTVLVPLNFDVGFFDGQPHFPGDIRDALASVPSPGVLVTTPVHLRALVAAARPVPGLHLVVSAAAPLPHQLAAAAERLFDVPVWEVYGCTEAGLVATRRPVVSDEWCMPHRMRIGACDGGFAIDGDHLADPVPFPDLIEPLGERSFRLLGRSGHMVKVGGKRSSPGAIEAALLEVPGVLDAAVLVEDSPDDGREARPVAILVAPQMDTRAILAGVRSRLDPAFVPREVWLVPSLPRSATSKLERTALRDLLASLREGPR